MQSLKKKRGAPLSAAAPIAGLALCLLLTAGPGPVLAAPSGTPQLELDPGGHKAFTRGLVLTRDGRYVASASDDKTIRVYLTETGELLRTFRGFSGPGFAGAFQSLAISPDDRVLAAGGYLEGSGFLRLYDFESGEILADLAGHTSTVIKIAFAPDGRTLYSSQTGTGPLIQWRREGAGWNKHILDPGAKDTYGLSLSADGALLATAGFDGVFRVWDKSGKLRRKIIDVAYNRLAFAPDGRRLLASGFDRTLTVYATRDLLAPGPKAPAGHVLALLPESHYGGKHIEEIAWTADGIFSAGPFQAFQVTPERAEYRRPIFRLDPISGEVRGIYTGHDNTVLAIAPGPGGLIASAGDNNHAVHLWDARRGQALRVLRGAGQAVFAVAFTKDGRGLYFGNANTQSRPNAIGPLTRSFALEELEVNDLNAPPAPADVHGPLEEQGGRSIRYKSELYNNTIEIGDWRVTLPEKNDTIYAYSFTPDGNIAAVGSAAGLFLFDVQSGDEIAQLKGHEGAVMALAFAPDGRRLVTGSADQTVRLWDVNSRSLLATFFFARDGEWIATTPDPFLMGSPGALKYFGWKINRGPDEAALFYSFDQFDLRTNRPDTVLARLFPEARSDAADDFARNMGNRIQALRRQRELRVAANGFRQEELDGTFELRAPVVQIIGRPPDYTITKNRTFPLRFTVRDEGDARIIGTRIFVNGVPLDHARTAGASQPEANTGALRVERTITLSAVGGGRNVIEVTGLNDRGVESRRETVRLLYRPHSPPAPVLYVAAFGVDRYAGGEFAPLHFAVKDAGEFAGLFDRAGRDAYPGGIRVLVKTDREVTREAIQDLERFWAGSSVDDTVLVYFSGHGLSRPARRELLGRTFADFDYFYATAGTNLKNLDRTAITIEEIRRLLETTPARQKMLFLDSCQSFVPEPGAPGPYRTATAAAPRASGRGAGGAGQPEILRLRGGGKLLFNAARGVPQSGATERFSQDQADLARFFPELRRGTGTIEVSAAINGQSALEGIVLSDGNIIENGVFTYSIREAMRAPQARDPSGKITARTLRTFVLRRVAELTTDEQGRARQTPMVARDIAGRDWTLLERAPVPPPPPADLASVENFYTRQIACGDRCLRLTFRPEQIKHDLREAMKAGHRKILIDLEAEKIKFKDPAFAELLVYLREVADRDGRVLIDPVEGQPKSLALVPLPLVKDVLKLGRDLWGRVYGFFYYRPAADYHARAIYDRRSDFVKLVYFSHKAAGDPCAELFARCDVVRYVDDALFDATLSDRLRRARSTGGTVRVTFDRQPARLPAARLDLDNLRSVQSSARIYKWLLVSGRAEKQKAAGEKAVGLALIVTVLDYSLQAYDLIKDIVLYAPARDMQARIFYEGEESGGSIQSVIFRPLVEKEDDR